MNSEGSGLAAHRHITAMAIILKFHMFALPYIFLLLNENISCCGVNKKHHYETLPFKQMILYVFVETREKLHCPDTLLSKYIVNKPNMY